MKKVILFVCLLIVTGSYSQLSFGLIAKYYFNNSNVADDLGLYPGSNNNAILTFDRFGCESKAFKFDQSNSSFISLGDNFDQFFSGDNAEFSFSFWFNSQNINNSGSPMIVKYSYSGCSEDQRQYSVELNNDNRMSFLYASTLSFNSLVEVQGNTVLNDSLWHHVVVNYDGTNDLNNGGSRVVIYIDNQEETMSVENSYGTTSFIKDGTAHVGIGAALSSNGSVCGSAIKTFDGLLDDIRFYNRSLTLNEVDSLYSDVSPCNEQHSSINKVKINNIQLFPNPSTGEVTIKLANTGTYTIELYATTGTLVQKDELIGNKKVLTFNKESGVYFIKVINESGKEFTERLIIE